MITKKFVLGVHSVLETLKLCKSGILAPEALEKAVKSQVDYKQVVDGYCHIVYELIASRVFTDGNKLTSFIILKELNKFGIFFDDSQLSYVILNLKKYQSITSEAVFIGNVKRCILM